MSQPGERPASRIWPARKANRRRGALGCYCVPVLDRARALQILGLSEGADESEIRSAYRALRAHIEGRSQASDDEAFRGERRYELLDLERALRGFGAVAVPRGGTEADAPARIQRLVPRWVLGWAIAATILGLAGWVAYLSLPAGALGPAVLFGGSGGEGTGSGGFAIEGEDAAEGVAPAGGDAESAGARAKLVAKSPVEGATLAVWTRGDAPQLAAEGAADDTEYWLSPGPYALRVVHAECEGAWEQELDARVGNEYSFEPEPCQDAGWLRVQSNVAQDELSIDGKPVGTTGERRHLLSAGAHEVRVAKAGYESWEGIIEVAPGREVGIRPRLARAAPAAAKRPPPRAAQGADASSERESGLDDSWHEQARQWLLSRFDTDRSGALDAEEELDAIPCDFWLGLQASHGQSRLGLTLIRFYGFDGKDWRSGALGISDEVRDLAHDRMQKCGLR